MIDDRMHDGDAWAAGCAQLIEGPRGSVRRDALAAARSALAADARVDVTELRCHFDEGGPWAGLNDLVAAMLPSLRQSAPELVVQHDYELALLLPELRRDLVVRNPSLTDTSAGDEAVRNYAMDRAYRIVHGLVDLIAAWRARFAAGRRWLIVCEDLDEAGALVRRAFGELLRRKGAALDLHVVATVAPGGESRLGDELRARVTRTHAVAGAGGETPATPAAPPDAAELQRTLAADPLALEQRLAELIAAWRAAGDGRATRHLQAWALGRCNHYGLYEDALRYGEQILDHLDEVSGGDEEVRWNLVGNLFHALVATGAAERARTLVEREALAKLRRPDLCHRAGYIMAMLHARYLPARDLDLAERYLLDAMAGVEAIELADDRRHFLAVFFGNGLAFVRQRQGRSAEAIALCRAGAERLAEHLGPERHRLHRSVLLFNVAQVLIASRAFEEAIGYLDDAIAIDPNYSEYYNDRGNAKLRLGRAAEALGDYERAIALSPPYAEVRVNLGQCLRQLGRREAAVAAFTAALDLQPDNRLAREARAQVCDELGHADAATGDYDELLRHEPDHAVWLANRAALHFDGGRLRQSLDDLDRAIALVPEDAQLRRNRALALDRAGRRTAAADDLRRAIALTPPGDEHASYVAALAQLERAEVAHG